MWPWNEKQKCKEFKRWVELEKYMDLAETQKLSYCQLSNELMTLIFLICTLIIICKGMYACTLLAKFDKRIWDRHLKG